MKFTKPLYVKRFLLVFCLGVLLLQIMQVLYFQRDTFLTKYDVPYWTDRVEHSRYMLPLSQRGINDDAFYAYGGYKILQGEDPTKIVYDKPALGIFFVGIFSAWVYNPAYSGLFFGIGVILLTYFIVYKITKSVLKGLITSTFLLLDLSIVYNLSTSALDLPQLFFLLTNILLLLYASKKKISGNILIFAAGFALGIFAQIKIPVIYPLIFLFEIILLYKLYGKSNTIFFFLGNAAALIVGYLPYLIHGYSFIDFLNIQKFILAFYKDSKLPLHPEAIWQFLFLGTFPGIVDRIPAKIAEWSIIYPIATITGIVYAIHVLREKKEQYVSKGFALLILISLLIFTFIPSFPRYIVLLLPFLYFFLVEAIFHKGYVFRLIVVVGICFYSLIASFIYLHQNPSSFLSGYYGNFSLQYFQDIYQNQIDSNTKTVYTRDEFRKIGQNTFLDAKIRSIEIKEEPYQYSIFNSSIIVPIVVTYKTEYLGTFSEKKQLRLMKVNEKWKIVWDWNYLLNDFGIDKKVSSSRIVGKRGQIIDNKQRILAQDTNGHLISFNSFLMNGAQEKDMLAYLNRLSFVSALDLQNTYLENPPTNEYVPLFTTHRTLSQVELGQLRSYSGMKVEEYPTRIYTQLDPKTIENTHFKECCTRIYSSFNYHGISGMEQTYEKELSGYDGGSLIIVDKKGETQKIIIQKDKKDGNDIILP